MLYKISSNKSLLLIVIVLFVYILAQRQCGSRNIAVPEKPQITIVKDTVYQVKIDTFYLQTTKYNTVFVPKINNDDDVMASVRTEQEISQAEKHLYEEARTYTDTLYNEDIEIYSYSLLKGELLKNNLSYKLKVPREIRTTTTIEHASKYKSGLYGFGEVGGNQNQFNNISLGLQYNRRGKWFVSYRMNFNQLSNVTHNIGIGIRIY
ncbi:hypothetical protein [Aquimarina sp. 2201CG14-23]|uniref:hypothetical protein n=1 Tax=Aquimarina mycalae TaxID=3040073 RepID=UPI002477E25F|nr:hypothetical protein [Aquimarina sp. 2201CG14-23]MDH7447693.1 hypothetical protein [Aquimarina sp. 2201CG14-23]